MQKVQSFMLPARLFGSEKLGTKVFMSDLGTAGDTWNLVLEQFISRATVLFWIFSEVCNCHKVLE